MACGLSACHENAVNPNRNISLEDFKLDGAENYCITSEAIESPLHNILNTQTAQLNGDGFAVNHYSKDGSLLWISREGVTHEADTLIAYLHSVKDMGFKESTFLLKEIESDLAKYRSMRFTADTTMASVAARLDYNLTKAYLRYNAGQRFGFTDPADILNHLDKEYKDSVRYKYKTLFGMKIGVPTDSIYDVMLSRVKKDSVAFTLRESQPENPLYYEFLEKYKSSDDEAEKKLLITNMERCRWRLDDYHRKDHKYVFVNIPSMRLLAVDGDSIEEMKVVCGAMSTKTPLLTGRLKRIDVNPKWNIPMSIIKGMTRHAGDSSYFARNNYSIIDNNTGKSVSIGAVSSSAMGSGRYSIVQAGGEGNSLGRLIFRFDNAYSIYLHDTPNKAAFHQSNRLLSHGCIRLERPFDMAKFLLKDKPKQTLDDIAFSIEKDKNTKGKKINNVALEPEVPVYLVYYTIYPHPTQGWQTYNDVYGHDKALTEVLKPLL